MNWETLIQLYQDHNPKRENHVFFSTVYKLDDLGPIMSGMANTIGGIICIGMDFKNVHLRGSNITEGLVEETLGTFFSSNINLKYTEVNRNSKTISVLQVLKSEDRPIYYKDTCYIFKNDNLFTASAEEEELMRHEQRHINRSSEENSQITTEGIIDENTTNSSEHFTIDELQSSNSTEIETSNEKSENEIEHSEPDIIAAESTFQVFKKETTPAFSAVNNYTPSESNFPQIPHPQATLETLEEFIIHLNKRQRKALKYLKKNNSIKNKIYRKIGEVSHKTAHIELTEMLQYGLIRSQGSGRSTHYVLNR